MAKLLAMVIGVAVVAPASAVAAETPSGFFNAPCRYSHRAPDDPIVSPGKPGASHSHDFLGNSSTNSRSTVGSLRGAPGLCTRSADRSAWWIPTLYENGHALAPEHVSIYYQTGGRDPATIESFPLGLRVIAGNSTATGPQPEQVITWSCHETDDVLGDPTAGFFSRQAQRRATLSRLAKAIAAHRRALKGGLGVRAARRHVRALRRLRARRKELRANPVLYGGLPLCAAAEKTRLTIRFPECWDGQRLDSPDHQAHMTFSTHRGSAPFRSCPASHPRAVPDVQLNLTYPTRGGPAVQLASGLEYTAHADFFNAWDPGGLGELVRNCLNAAIHC